MFPWYNIVLQCKWSRGDLKYVDDAPKSHVCSTIYCILYKEFEHPWTGVSVAGLEPTLE